MSLEVLCSPALKDSSLTGVVALCVRQEKSALILSNTHLPVSAPLLAKYLTRVPQCVLRVLLVMTVLRAIRCFLFPAVKMASLQETPMKAVYLVHLDFR